MKEIKIKPLKVQWIISLLIGAFFVLVLIFEINYSDTFYPGVSIGDLDVGGRNYDEIVGHFEEKSNNLYQNGLTLNFSGQKGNLEIKIPQSSEGLTSDNTIEYFVVNDWRSVISDAYLMGREGSWAKRFGTQVGSFFFGKKYYFYTEPNRDAIISLLDRELDSFLIPVVQAGFYFENNTLAISSEGMGEKIDTNFILDSIINKLKNHDSTPEFFQVEVENPTVVTAMLAPYLADANKIATTATLTYMYGKNKWKLSSDLLASMLTVKDSGSLGVDDEKIKEYFKTKVNPKIDNPPINSRFKMEKGTLVEISPGTSGNIVDVSSTIDATDNQINILYQSMKEGKVVNEGWIISIPVMVVVAEPLVTQQTIEDYEIKDLIGTAKTSFKGSSKDRTHNVTLGASKLNGLLLAPGEEFSTLKAIGPSNEETGFAKESVIKGDKTVKEYGGGLCQIATTIFRLVLNTGLPVTERYNHSYAVGYYGPGLDATIYTPRPDFRFMNDTGHYILLQTRVENQEVIMEFYGQNDGRVSELSDIKLTNHIPAPPVEFIPSEELMLGEMKCSETPHDGVTTDVTYKVTYVSGEVKERNFHSVYKPWGEKCLVGTAVTPPVVSSE